MESGRDQISLVKKLSFVRYGGTEEELRAARILLDEIQGAGGEGELMDFPVPASRVEACAAAALELGKE